MKTFTSAASRALGDLAWASFWGISGTAAAWGLPRFLVWSHSQEGRYIRSEDLALITGLTWAFTGLIVLGCLVGATRVFTNRYELGTRDLTIHSGFLWRTSRTLPIMEIKRIETVSGPLMRPRGLADLRVFSKEAAMCVTLYGLRNATEARRAILERRDVLREAAMEGGLTHLENPRDLLFERLNRVLERIERRLPSARASTPEGGR